MKAHTRVIKGGEKVEHLLNTDCRCIQISLPFKGKQGGRAGKVGQHKVCFINWLCYEHFYIMMRSVWWLNILSKNFMPRRMQFTYVWTSIPHQLHGCINSTFTECMQQKPIAKNTFFLFMRRRNANVDLHKSLNYSKLSFDLLSIQRSCKCMRAYSLNSINFSTLMMRLYSNERCSLTTLKQRAADFKSIKIIFLRVTNT